MISVHRPLMRMEWDDTKQIMFKIQRSYGLCEAPPRIGGDRTTHTLCSKPTGYYPPQGTVE